MTAPRPIAPWAAAAERGSPFWVGLGLRLVFGLGWWFGRLLLLPITGWFFVTSPGARAASRDYLARALRRPATTRDVLRHVHSFAASILDAPFLVAGRTARFRIEVEGTEHLDRALASGRGCVLLGGHLGSQAVLRHFARLSPVPVRPLMFRRNDGVLARALDRLDPVSRRQVIEIGAPESLLAAREALAAGEIVGILGDRDPTDPGDGIAERRIVVPFLGDPAMFPTGPMLLVAALRAPVVLIRATSLGPRHYRVCLAPFESFAASPRIDRAAAVRAAVTGLAAFLEAGCRAQPYQWFNFYPFWKDAAPDAIAPAAAPDRPPGDDRQRGPGERRAA